MFRFDHLVKIVVAFFMALAIATSAFAGNKEEELKNEISYLAKQLLNIRKTRVYEAIYWYLF